MRHDLAISRVHTTTSSPRTASAPAGIRTPHHTSRCLRPACEPSDDPAGAPWLAISRTPPTVSRDKLFQPLPHPAALLETTRPHITSHTMATASLPLPSPRLFEGGQHTFFDFSKTPLLQSAPSSGSNTSDMDLDPNPHDVVENDGPHTGLRTTKRPPQVGDHTADTRKQHDFQCVLCSATFGTKRSLVRHQRPVSCVGQPLASHHACALCGLTFARKDDHLRHEKLQHATGRVECHLCGRQVAARSLPEHRRTRRCLRASRDATADVDFNELSIGETHGLTLSRRKSISFRAVDAANLMRRLSTCNQSMSQRGSLLFKFPVRCRVPTYHDGPRDMEASMQHWHNAAVWALKLLLLQIVSQEITKPNAGYGSYQWLRCLAALAETLGDKDEARLHETQVDRMHDRLLRESSCPVEKIEGSGSCRHCARNNPTADSNRFTWRRIVLDPQSLLSSCVSQERPLDRLSSSPKEQRSSTSLDDVLGDYSTLDRRLRRVSAVPLESQRSSCGTVVRDVEGLTRAAILTTENAHCVIIRPDGLILLLHVGDAS